MKAGLRRGPPVVKLESRDLKTLSTNDCTDWLVSRKLPVDPYCQWRSSPPYYKQFSLLHNSLRMTAPFSSIVHGAEPFGTSLLHITDWTPYYPAEMALVAQVRKACGEDRLLIETPGHEFIAEERDLLIGLLAVITSYGWTAYVYFDHGLTLLSWEGEIMDFWDSDHTRFQAMCGLMQDIGIVSLETKVERPT
jgi:hypothetical protein